MKELRRLKDLTIDDNMRRTELISQLVSSDLIRCSIHNENDLMLFWRKFWSILRV